MGEFDRIPVKTYYPVVNVSYGLGVKGLLNGDFNYRRLSLEIDQWFNVRSFGWSRYIITAGKTWNPLPWPLLSLLPGNETLSFDEFAFNMMNYFEFVTDEYASFYYTHHFNGYFLNRIPLLRKLKWREVAWVKGVIGHLDNQNYNFNEFSKTYINSEVQQNNINPLTKPYYEAGVAIENILRVLRIDFLWRFSYLNNDSNYHYSWLDNSQHAKRYGVMFTLQFQL